MRDHLQPAFNPLTRGQKLAIYFALWPLCLLISLAVLKIAYDRTPDFDDVLVGYLMLPFSLPYSFLDAVTFGQSGYDGASRASAIAGFWLPFFTLHMIFFFSRSMWSLIVLAIVWILSSFKWHYFALVLMSM